MDTESKAWFPLNQATMTMVAVEPDLNSTNMLIDACFFGIPMVIAACLAAHAVRDEAPKFWLPAVSMFSYCMFYLFGGREVILWLLTIMMMGGGVLNSGGLIG